MAQARALAADRGYSALLLCTAPRRNGGQSAGNVAHFTGYIPLSGTTLLLLPTVGNALVMSDGPNEARMLAARISHLAEVTFAPNLAAAVVEHCDRLRLGHATGTAGVPELSARLWRRLMDAMSNAAALYSVDAAIHALRAEVDLADLDLHREASRIGDLMIGRAFEAAVETGMTPARLMAEVEATGRRLGAEIARLWLAVGANPPVTAFEFFELPDRITPGDRIQLGTTVCVEGHFSQELRMAVLGEPEPRLAAAVDRLLRIQDDVARALVPGRKAHEIVDLLESLIEEACPYTRATDPLRFQSCHQLGLDYSDAALAGALDAGRDRTLDGEGPRLRTGQVLEIHPNYSLPGLGHVCAGDALAVTETGGEWLTKFPRGLTRLMPRS